MLKRYYILLSVLLTVAAGLCIWNAIAQAEGFGHTTFHTYRDSQMLMHGTLFDPYGNPATGVGIQVTVRPFDGEPATVYGGFTGRGGHYAIRIPRGPSRLITVSMGGTTREVKEIVRPNAWLSISVGRHRHMVFSGGFIGSRTAGAPTVLVQARPTSGRLPWATFGASNPNWRSHLWRYRYTPTRSLSGSRFWFRAITLPTSAYARGYSDAKEAIVP